MVTKSLVLKENKEAMLLNWIKFYFWEGKDIKDSFIKSLEHYAEMYKYNIEIDITQDQVKEFIVNYIKSFTMDSVFEGFLRKLYFTNICKGFKELMKKEELPFKKKRELHSFILTVVIPSIN